MKKYKTPNIVVFKIHPFYVLQASKINASLRYRNSYVRYEERDEDGFSQDEGSSRSCDGFDQIWDE